MRVNMGTNYYFKANEEGQLPNGFQISGCNDGWSSDDWRVHIGKRSAAGAYCWTCGISLAKDPNRPFVSTGPRLLSSIIHGGGRESHASCPSCGMGAKDEKMNDPGNAIGMMLGFASPHPSRPQGVGSCCSFTFAQEPARIISLCVRWPNEIFVEDEYCHKFTGEEFLKEILLLSPIWFTGQVGGYFS